MKKLIVVTISGHFVILPQTAWFPRFPNDTPFLAASQLPLQARLSVFSGFSLTLLLTLVDEVSCLFCF